MSSMDINKGMAGVLVAGITFFLCGTLATALVSEKRLEKTAITIATSEAPAASAAPKAAEIAPIGPLLASADVAGGEATAKKLCAACHTFTDGGKAGVAAWRPWLAWRLAGWQGRLAWR